MRFQSRGQTCEVSGSDTLLFSWSGIIDPADVTALYRQVREHCKDWPSMFCLWDMTAMQLIPGETRRCLLDEVLSLPLDGTAVVTSEFLLRVPVTMLLEVAATEMSRRPPYRFAPTVDEAAAWLRTLPRRGA